MIKSILIPATGEILGDAILDTALRVAQLVPLHAIERIEKRWTSDLILVDILHATGCFERSPCLQQSALSSRAC
jgi:hypothetical protein